MVRKNKKKKKNKDLEHDSIFLKDVQFVVNTELLLFLKQFF